MVAGAEVVAADVVHEAAAVVVLVAEDEVDLPDGRRIFHGTVSSSNSASATMLRRNCVLV